MSMFESTREETACQRFSALTNIDFGLDYAVVVAKDERFDGAVVCIVSVPRFGWVKGWLKSALLARAQLYHPHVLKLYDVFPSEQDVHVVFESPKGGNLLTLVKTNRFDENQARFVFQQLVFAVSYFHSMGIHGIDLTPERIFYDVETGILKIGDLGLHDISGNGGDYALPYVSKEQLGDPDGTTTYHRESDVWHLGAILYFILFRRYPFCPDADTSTQQHIFNILRVNWGIPRGSLVSEDCMELFTRIFTRRPEDRISVSEIQAHTWYKKNLPDGVVQYNSVLRPDDGLVQKVEQLADYLT